MFDTARQFLAGPGHALQVLIVLATCARGRDTAFLDALTEYLELEVFTAGTDIIRFGEALSLRVAVKLQTYAQDRLV